MPMDTVQSRDFRQCLNVSAVKETAMSTGNPFQITAAKISY